MQQLASGKLRFELPFSSIHLSLTASFHPSRLVFQAVRSKLVHLSIHMLMLIKRFRGQRALATNYAIVRYKKRSPRRRRRAGRFESFRLELAVILQLQPAERECVSSAPFEG